MGWIGACSGTLDNPNPNPNTGDGDGGDGGGGACGHEHGHRVWVPLCGKSVDVTWLAVSGHRVLGVELSGVAIDQLFHDFRLPRTTWQPPAPRGVHRVHTCGNIGLVEVRARRRRTSQAVGGPWEVNETSVADTMASGNSSTDVSSGRRVDPLDDELVSAALGAPVGAARTKL